MRRRARWGLLILSAAVLFALLLTSRYRVPEAVPLALARVGPRGCADIADISPRQSSAAQRPAPLPSPIPAAGPAPTEDRIGFPVGYQENFALYFVIDRPDLREVRVACANVLAASALPGQPLPYGSVFIMEGWAVAVDERGLPIFDASGHLIREQLNSLMVMRKGEGFGAAYGEARTGAWEYGAYQPDGSYLVAPQQSHSCAACHRQQSSAEADWLFRSRLFFKPTEASRAPEAGPREVIPFHYLFRPGTVNARVGSTITWSNLDEVWYTITAADGSFDSGPLAPGQHFNHTFNQAGRYEYFSSFHPGMRGTIQIIE
ncbi:MAG: cytochrome P460 family protein [Ardenticatenales bacterium]|nr:cytochrome P460 family protein [Ardenticatenales bacterium]